MLLEGSPLGINSSHISGDENVVADDISRLTKSDPSNSFDYSLLKQKYPELATCCLFQPAPVILSPVWKCLLKKKSPSLKQIQTLKRQGLGKLIS